MGIRGRCPKQMAGERGRGESHQQQNRRRWPLPQAELSEGGRKDQAHRVRSRRKKPGARLWRNRPSGALIGEEGARGEGQPAAGVIHDALIAPSTCHFRPPPFPSTAPQIPRLGHVEADGFPVDKAEEDRWILEKFRQGPHQAPLEPPPGSADEWTRIDEAPPSSSAAAGGPHSGATRRFTLIAMGYSPEEAIKAGDEQIRALPSNRIAESRLLSRNCRLRRHQRPADYPRRWRIGGDDPAGGEALAVI